MRIGSLFSGIGGLDLGLEWAGLGSPTWFCESDAFCRSVLRHHHPGIPIHPDIRELRDVSADLICGGFPCTDLSTAGRKEGFFDENGERTRSGLWFEMLRVIQECRPVAVVVENVWNASKTWVPVVRGGLADIGYRPSPVLRVRACDVGARHERARGFVIARLFVQRWRDSPSVARAGEGLTSRVTSDDASLGRGTGMGGWRRKSCEPAPNNESEPGRWRMEQRQETPQPSWALWLDSAIREATDAHRARLEEHLRQRRDDGKELTAPFGNAGQEPWPGAQAFDPLVRGVHGVPVWLDWFTARAGWTPAEVHAAAIRSLGNAVVPPVAHAVGLVLKQWLESEKR